MEMFTSQDPVPELMTEDMIPLEDLVQSVEESQYLEEGEYQIMKVTPSLSPAIIEDTESSLFTDQEQSQDNELLVITQEIHDLLKDYLVEETTEETTDYIKLLYEGQKSQGEEIQEIKKIVGVSVKDQQTIGLLSVGASVLLIGALTVFIFLGRIR